MCIIRTPVISVHVQIFGFSSTSPPKIALTNLATLYSLFIVNISFKTVERYKLYVACFLLVLFYVLTYVTDSSF